MSVNPTLASALNNDDSTPVTPREAGGAEGARNDRTVIPATGSVRAGQPVHGELHLRFRALQRNGALATAVDTVRHAPPLRIVRPFPMADGGALIHLHNVSGGVLGGDCLHTTLALDAGARAQVTTTSATRIYRQRQGRPAALQVLDVRIGDNALLEYLPDPVIPYAGSAYQQQTRFVLADGAGLFAWDIFAPGREAHGECFAYDILAWETVVEAITAHEARPIAIERARLEPAQRPLAASARLGSFRYLATFYACRVGADAALWMDVERALQDVATRRTQPGASWWGASTLIAHGVIVRGLGVKGDELMAALPEFWRTAKHILYGEAAIAPRKIY